MSIQRAVLWLIGDTPEKRMSNFVCLTIGATLVYAAWILGLLPI